jgi:hypothetical protein
MSGSAVIVGHGPSLRTAGLGKKIEACDKVIRLKNCGYLLAEPQNYGKRTDILCSSTETLYNLPKLKAKEYWGYPKKGTYAPARVRRAERRLGKTIVIPEDACNLWNCFFLELGGKHPNVSTGMGAIIIALDRLKPETLYLAGFDTLLNPAVKYSSTVETPWNKDGNYPDHDWAVENQMLPFLAAHFNAEIKDLAGRHEFFPSGVRTVWKALPSNIEGVLPREDRSVLGNETRH